MLETLLPKYTQSSYQMMLGTLIQVLHPSFIMLRGFKHTLTHPLWAGALQREEVGEGMRMPGLLPGCKDKHTRHRSDA